MDLRMDLIEGKLKEIQNAMREAVGDMNRVMQLMQEFKDMQQLRDMLARKLGSDVVVS
jgi:DNA primase